MDMKRILYYMMFLLVTGNGMLIAQNMIHGKVTDMDNVPIDGVAVVLQTLVPILGGCCGDR